MTTPEQNTQSFPEVIGQDYEMWARYREVHGPEAYRWRRLYEEAARQLTNLYAFGDENGIELPGPGPGAT